jgi:hypothetical protein
VMPNAWMRARKYALLFAVPVGAVLGCPFILYI